MIMVLSEIILLGFIGSKIAAPWWYWFVYSALIASFLVPLVEGFIEGYTHAAESDGDD